MSRKVKIDLGINGAFLTRRWEEPDNWMRLTKETGYDYHEFCGDVLDPFFSGDKEYQLETARKTKEAAEKHGVTIVDIYTGVATHRFHGLAHSHPAVRARMRDWIVEAMDIALAMGVTKLGGHWDALSVEVLEDPEKERAAIELLHNTFRELAVIGKEKGMEGIYVEQMYIPSEVPWTMEQSDEYLVAVNKDNPGCPVYLTVDVGHMAGMHYGLQGKDLEYEEWLRRFGAACEVIHLQQTTRDASRHWTFNEEYNATGDIKMEEVLKALKWSHENYHRQPWAKYLAPAAQTTLVLEYIPGSTTTEERVLREISEGCSYLRNYVPKGGLEWEFDK
ncbi:MAG: TIM barrel protein [Bacillota bacterium]|jgi:sugar phosphate isomerase/epimerase|nr:TIM barrel protein [Bacillota bacterium]NLJ02406.1 sugar phosphate isomerase/epimerase [Bacillota bacterium]